MSKDFSKQLEDLMDEPCRASWSVIGNLVDLAESPKPELTGGTDIDNGRAVLVRAYAGRTYEFLSSDQLLGMASKDGRHIPEGKIDVPDYPGVYIFVSVFRHKIIKVGESSRLRERIAKEHLRTEGQVCPSNLCGYYYSFGKKWPDSIKDDEITCILLLMTPDNKAMRLSVERGLTKLLLSEIRR